jgi:hypothetical protein
LTDSRLRKVSAATRPQFDQYIVFDAGHVVGMLYACVPPCRHFDLTIELRTQIEQRQFRLAPNRIAFGQFREDFLPCPPQVLPESDSAVPLSRAPRRQCGHGGQPFGIDLDQRAAVETAPGADGRTVA